MDNKTSIGAIGGVIAVLAIAFVFALFPAESDDTIILVNKQGTDPVNSCAPGNGLILAQNLTDLCDVVIVSPSTSQLLRYNGSFWVNVNTSVVFNDTTTCNNIGTGSAFVCVEGSNVDLRSLLAGTAISISNNTNTITVTNDAPESTVCTNQTTGHGLCINDTIELKNLVAGIGMSLSSSATHITISNTGVVSNLCQTGINCSGTTLATFNTDFANGTGISITGTGTQTFTNTGVTSITSADTATLSYNASTGNILTTPTLKKLCEFTGVGGETSIACTFSSSQQVFSVQVHYNSSVTNTVWVLRFNNDTGNNYSYRIAINGGADSTSANQAFLGTQTITENIMNSYMLECHNHSATYEKWCNGDRTTMTSGSGVAPARVEIYTKWADRTQDVTSINLTRTGSTGTLNSSHIIVWGYS